VMKVIKRLLTSGYFCCIAYDRVGRNIEGTLQEHGERLYAWIVRKE
jgi:hypothetical protein